MRGVYNEHEGNRTQAPSSIFPPSSWTPSSIFPGPATSPLADASHLSSPAYPPPSSQYLRSSSQSSSYPDFSSGNFPRSPPRSRTSSIASSHSFASLDSFGEDAEARSSFDSMGEGTSGTNITLAHGGDGFTVDLSAGASGAGGGPPATVNWSQLVGFLLDPHSTAHLGPDHLVKKMATLLRTETEKPSAASLVTSRWNDPSLDVASGLESLAVHPSAPTASPYSHYTPPLPTGTAPIPIQYPVSNPNTAADTTDISDVQSISRLSIASQERLAARRASTSVPFNSGPAFYTPLQQAFAPGGANSPAHRHSNVGAYPSPPMAPPPCAPLPQLPSFVPSHTLPSTSPTYTHYRGVDSGSHHSHSRASSLASQRSSTLGRREHDSRPYARPSSQTSHSKQSSNSSSFLDSLQEALAQAASSTKVKSPIPLTALNGKRVTFLYDHKAHSLYRASPGEERTDSSMEVIAFPPGSYVRVMNRDMEVLPSDAGGGLNAWLKGQECVTNCKFSCLKKRPVVIRNHFATCKARAAVMKKGDPLRRLCEVLDSNKQTDREPVKAQNDAAPRRQLRTEPTLDRRGSFSSTSQHSGADEDEEDDESFFGGLSLSRSMAMPPYQDATSSTSLNHQQEPQPEESSQATEHALLAFLESFSAKRPQSTGQQEVKERQDTLDWSGSNNEWLTAHGFGVPTSGDGNTMRPGGRGSFLSMD